MSNKHRSTQSTRNVRLNDTSAAMLAAQKLVLKTKLGREPGPEDPVFFDPNASTPQPIPKGERDRHIAIAIKAVGADPAVIYAFECTGLIVTEETYHLIQPRAQIAYTAALKDFKRISQS